MVHPLFMTNATTPLTNEQRTAFNAIARIQARLVAGGDRAGSAVCQLALYGRVTPKGGNETDRVTYRGHVLDRARAMRLAVTL
jgi:hypothetical protein